MTIVSNNCSIMLKASKKKRKRSGGTLKHELQDKMFCNELIFKQKIKRMR